MKKIIILCSTALLFSFQTFAQTFAFLHKGKQLENNAEITVIKATPTGLEGELVLESELGMKNLTDNYVDTRMTQTVLTGPTFPAGTISFCFFECMYVMTSSTDTYRESEVSGQEAVKPYEVWEDPRFHLSFYVSKNLYTGTKIKYEIYPIDNPDDKTTVFITYTYNENSTALSNINRQNKISVSQEGNDVRFTYSLGRNNSLIEIYNIIGNRVSQHRLESDKGTFVVQEKLPEGIYIYTVKQGNKIIIANKFKLNN
jgi:hypothetical protein